MITGDNSLSPNIREDSLKSSYQLCKKDTTYSYLSCRLANFNAPPGALSPDNEGGSTNSPLHLQGIIPENAPAKGLRLFRSKSLNLKSNGQNVTINCDYLQGTVRYHNCSTVLSLKGFIDSSFGTNLRFHFPAHFRSGEHTYDHVAECPITGVKLAYFRHHGSGLYYVTFVIPGKALRVVHPEAWLSFVVRGVVNFNLKFTRIDGKVDDYLRRVERSKLLKLAQNGDCAKVRKYLYIISGVIGQKDGVDSIYLGSNRRLLNVYDAEYMHGLDADRWEGRFREGRAEHLARYFVDHFDIDSDIPITEQVNDCLRYLGNYVLKIVDFVKRKQDKSRELKRYRRYKFFSSLLKDVGEVDIGLLPKPENLNAIEFVQKTFDWGNKQIFKRFALMAAAFAFDFAYLFNQCLAAASEKFTKDDILWIQEIQNFIGDSFSDTEEIRNYFNNYLVPY